MCNACRYMVRVKAIVVVEDFQWSGKEEIHEDHGEAEEHE